VTVVCRHYSMYECDSCV